MQGKRKPYRKDPKKLNLYRKVLDFIENMYAIVEHYPSIERYNLCDQIRRASTSVLANLNEAQASIYYKKEYSQLDVAVGSASECRAFLDISLMRSYITIKQHEQLDMEAEQILKMLIGLMNKLERESSDLRMKVNV